MPTNFTVIIPARYDSMRFPGKMLVKLKGKEILAWVYEKACLSNAGAVHIATDDERIAELCSKINAPVVMTSNKHNSGTDRVHEAAQSIGLDDDDIVVNVQGDEPLLAHANINQLAGLLQNNHDFPMASLTTPIMNEQELQDPNCVKAVQDISGRALYFSRHIIPAGDFEAQSKIWQRHLGVYAYRMGFLTKYVSWKPSIYEKQEKLEQLRALSNGIPILLAPAQEVSPPGIDTPADLKHLEELIK